mmetsp:Transcript_94838/g.296581  ORF Transcript_94838/g.296581 Transcript_94838/m.296581 type:complete len:105 (-) Transcript_94838:96-410(-)
MAQSPEDMPVGNGWVWTGMKTIKVPCEGEDELVMVDGEKGPIVNMADGGWKFFRWDNMVKGSKAGQWLGDMPQQFYQMSSTGKEIMVHQVAKTNKRLRDRFVTL